MSSTIPRRIFLFWHNGFQNAPPIVRLCRDSWHAMNPEYEVIELDSENVHDWLDFNLIFPEYKSLSVQKFSNLLRMAILEVHGGVWADATLFCAQSLDSMVLADEDADLVVLKTTPQQSGRTIHNFFLASAAKNDAINIWLKEYVRFLSSGVKPLTPGSMRRWRRRRPYLFRTFVGSLFWTSPIVGRQIGYPYLIAHYQVNRLILVSRTFRRALRRASVHRAGEALRFSTVPGGGAMFKNQLFANEFPLWKLSWRVDITPDYWNEVLTSIRDYAATNE